MHDTAFKIGGLVIQSYARAGHSTILEIGSLDVNGSLRTHIEDKRSYIGIDFSAGPGVDYVISGNDDWPVENDFFDLVIASSVLEHDVHFWETFFKMAQKCKPGGYIYINAPANGWVHRYPVDCWRFYPDCGGALTSWVERQGVKITLIESFTAEREDDVWNDFCAIFRREPAKSELPGQLISEQVPCTNVITFREPNMANVRESSEDMALIQASKEKYLSIENKCAALSSKLEEVEAQHDKLRSQFWACQSNTKHLKDELERIEIESKFNLAHKNWFKTALMTIKCRPFWYFILPKSWQEKYDGLRLRRAGIFDGIAYLNNYPDVADAKMDPFRHYILHGMAEGRII